MSDTALSVPDDAPRKPQNARRVRLPTKVRKAVALLASGECKTQKAASVRIGMNESYLSRMLSREDIRVFLAQEMRRTIATAGLRASHRIAELIDAGSEHVSLDASKHVLGINGIKPAADAQVSVSIDIKAGYVIDLSDGGPGDRAKVVEAHTVSTDREYPDSDDDSH